MKPKTRVGEIELGLDGSVQAGGLMRSKLPGWNV